MYLGPISKPFHKAECQCERCCQWMVDEIDRLNAEIERIQTDLLQRARLYQADDGSPGPLSDQWAWRDLASCFREAVQAAAGDQEQADA